MHTYIHTHSHVRQKEQTPESDSNPPLHTSVYTYVHLSGWENIPITLHIHTHLSGGNKLQIASSKSPYIYTPWSLEKNTPKNNFQTMLSLFSPQLIYLSKIFQAVQKKKKKITMWLHSLFLKLNDYEYM